MECWIELERERPCWNEGRGEADDASSLFRLLSLLAEAISFILAAGLVLASESHELESDGSRLLSFHSASFLQPPTSPPHPSLPLPPKNFSHVFRSLHPA